MESWLQCREYIYPQIVNEVITQMGQSVLRKVLQNIRADEVSDVTFHP